MTIELYFVITDLQNAVSHEISESRFQKYDDLKQRCEALEQNNECFRIRLKNFCLFPEIFVGS